MKLSLFKLDVSHITSTIVRFPLTFALSFLGMILALYVTSETSYPHKETLLVATILGAFCSLALSLLLERRKNGKYVAIAITLLFVASYYFYLPQGFSLMRTINLWQSFLLGLFFVLLIMVAPYVGKKNKEDEFWHYNKQLVTRVIFTGITTGTLFIGIVLSLASLAYLFDIDVELWPLRVWIVVVSMISSTVFLTGIPKDFEKSDSIYPRLLKVFSKYVLLLLILLYTLILYIYGIKILFTQDWPKGNVSIMVLLYALVGIITFLFLYPLQQKEKWVNKLRELYFILLIPVLMLLFAAVYIRISQYGLTHARLAIIVLGGYLCWLSTYQLSVARQNLKVYFITFGLLLLLFSFGPISAFEIAKKNQIMRLEKILSENKILVNGKIQKKDDLRLNNNEKSRIFETLDYLSSVNGLKNIQTWFGKDYVFEKKDPNDLTLDYQKIFASMGQKYDFSAAEPNDPYYSFQSTINGYSVKGYDFEYAFDFNCQNEKCTDDNYEKGANYAFNVSYNGGNIEIKDMEGRLLGSVDVSKKSAELINEYGHVDENKIPVEKMVFEGNSNGLAYKLQLDQLNVKQDDKEELQEILGRVLLKGLN